MLSGPIDLSAVRKAHRKFEHAHRQMTNRVLVEAGEFAQTHVAQASKPKRRTGALAKATEYKVIRGRNGKILKVRNKKKYAKAQDLGSRPHVIRARRGKTLAFRGRGGRMVFRRSVMHPGTKPTRFLFRATNAAYRFAGQRFAVEMPRIASKF